jgi:hypothetical protein
MDSGTSAHLSAEALKWVEVQAGQFSQRRAAAGRQAHSHEAPILCSWPLAYQASPGSSLNQAHYGVVPFLEELGQFGNGGPPPAGVRCYSQKQLVLLGSDATGPRGALAVSQKTSKPVAEPRRPAERQRGKWPGFGNWAWSFHPFKLYHNVMYWLSKAHQQKENSRAQGRQLIPQFRLSNRPWRC